MHVVTKICFLLIQLFGTTWTFFNAIMGMDAGVLITGNGVVSLTDISRTFSPTLLMCWSNCSNTFHVVLCL